ncbi:MAG: MATE family efflux transporter [Oscillospiraceae bacterium]
MDLLTGKPSAVFKHYLSNAVIGSMSVALYVLCDTIFVGQGVGENGLAALNVAIPVFNVMTAFGMLLGVGGATSMSILRGQGEEEKAKDFFSLSVIIGVIFTIVCAIVGTVFIDQIIMILGANEVIFNLTKEYLQPLMVFGGIYLFNYLLQVYIRNDGNPRLPMITGIFSGILNIILDALFIFKFNMGMRGAIVATIISTICGILVLLTHFKSDRCTLVLKIPTNIKENILRIIRNGLPSFILEASAGLIIALFNIRLKTLIGINGISAYSIIANINYIMLAVFNGTAQAIQPAVSVNIGALKVKRAEQFLKLGAITCVICGIIFAVSGWLFSVNMVYLFLQNPSEGVVAISAISIRIYFFAYLFDGSNIVCGMFLQAAEKSKLSTAISALRGIILTIIGMYVLPLIFGVNGVWGTVVFAEAVTLIFSIIFVSSSLKKFRAIAVESDE